MRGHYFYIIVMHYNLENIFIKQHFETQLESIKTENTCIHLWGVNQEVIDKSRTLNLPGNSCQMNNIYKFCSYIYLDLISIINFFIPIWKKTPTFGWKSLEYLATAQLCCPSVRFGLSHQDAVVALVFWNHWGAWGISDCR